MQHLFSLEHDIFYYSTLEMLLSVIKMCNDQARIPL